MIPLDWTLGYGDTVKTFSQWGICEVRRRRLNQGCDVLTFRHISSNALKDPPLFEAFHSITIFHGDERWFQGVITEIPVRGSGTDESHHYKVCGPWWQLETIIYQQPWKIVANPDEKDPILVNAHKSHIILGQSITGGMLTLSEQLNDIATYAINCGAPMAIASIDMPQTIPFDECKDLSCAEAMERVLRWIPDVVVWFDYSTSPPTFHAERRFSLDVQSYAIGNSMELMAISPRYGLSLLGVAIKYEKTHSNNGHSWRTLAIDRYPEEISEQQPRVLTMTVELAGTRSQYILQSIVTQEIQPQNALWWCEHIPALASIDPSTISLISYGRSSSLPRELCSGGIADWMNVTVEDDVIWAIISYGDANTEISQQRVAIRIRATDALTRNYTQLSSYESEESTPSGLAQAIYESFAATTYEGTLQWVGDEIVAVAMGTRLNLVGGQIAWEKMDAEIQECTEDIDSGTVRLRFGPAVHLGMKDLVQLTRANRGREAPRSMYIRMSGEGSDEHINQPGDTPLQNGQTGMPSFGKILLKNSEDGTRKISLDTDGIPLSGLTIRPREEYVCADGNIMKRLTLASQPYDTIDDRKIKIDIPR
ncbi:MAG: hypothetical protein LBG86_00875 [Puniceicoccales bacterium]|jgi:hypothetical protein|nr:hypothetical protein [Puniceicoccales bacterium]